MFGPDHEQIPTLYRDTQLIYKSSDFNNPNADGSVSGTPTDYYLERFSDLGWSIGLTRLSNPDGTKYRTAVIEQNFYPGCSAVRNLQLQQDASLVIDKINGVPITGSNVSSVGTVTGLTMGTEYTVDAYIGTTPVGGQVMADVHMFGSFELYDLKDYELDSTGYAIINIPDYMWSGYYYINGMGLFRYVNGYKAYGTNDVEYNTAYFMGKDKNGNIGVEFSNIPVDQGREQALRTLGSGSTYDVMRHELFPRVCRLNYQLTFGPRPVTIQLTSYRNGSIPASISPDNFYQAATAFEIGSQEFCDIIDLAARLFPNCAEAAIDAAGVALLRGDAQRARKYLLAWETDPRAWCNLGLLHLLEGNRDKAEVYLRMAEADGVIPARDALKSLQWK